MAKPKPGHIEINGVPSSAELRAQLAEEGRPQLLAFSGGKDSIAAWLALRDSGVDVVPFYLWYLPRLRFVDETLAYFEEWYGQRIARYPHPSFYRWLNALTFQSPERLSIIEAAELPEPSYRFVADCVREDFGLASDTWECDGVRAADSVIRRTAFTRNGALRASTLKASVVWDWRKHHVMTAIEDAGIPLPVDYEWFGRSFDGIGYQFLPALKEHAPDDFQTILDWFPLADLELIRRGL